MQDLHGFPADLSLEIAEYIIIFELVLRCSMDSPFGAPASNANPTSPRR